MVSSGDAGMERKTSCRCPPPFADSDNVQDGDQLPISVSVHAATQGAEANTCDESQEQHGKTAAATAVKLEGVGGGGGGGGGGGDDDGGSGSQSDYSEFAGGEGDEEEQYSDFVEDQVNVNAFLACACVVAKSTLLQSCCETCLPPPPIDKTWGACGTIRLPVTFGDKGLPSHPDSLFVQRLTLLYSLVSG